MILRILSWLIFVVLMTLIIASSSVVVVFLYLPFVALKAVLVTISGKSRPPVTRSSTTGESATS